MSFWDDVTHTVSYASNPSNVWHDITNPGQAATNAFNNVTGHIGGLIGTNAGSFLGGGLGGFWGGNAGQGAQDTLLAKPTIQTPGAAPTLKNADWSALQGELQQEKNMRSTWGMLTGSGGALETPTTSSPRLLGS